MTTRTLLSLLTLSSLLFGCAEGESLPGSGSQTGGKTATDTSTPSEGGSSSAAKGGATSTAAATGGKTSTTGATSAGGTTTATTTPTPAADCGAVTSDVTLTHSARGGTETGGTSKIVPAAGKTITVGDLSLQYCFSIIGTQAPSATNAARIDSAGIQTSSDPYYTDAKSGITSSFVASATAGRYCLVISVSSGTGAALTLTGTDSISINWILPNDSLGASMIDPRPEAAPQVIVTNAGATAACVAAPVPTS